MAHKYTILIYGNVLVTTITIGAAWHFSPSGYEDLGIILGLANPVLSFAVQAFLAVACKLKYGKSIPHYIFRLFSS